MKNGRKVLISVALTIFVLMWLLPYHVYCDTDIGDWHIDLLSYTYDESEQGFAPLDAMDYIQSLFFLIYLVLPNIKRRSVFYGKLQKDVCNSLWGNR
mgnify:CR=1 FL=1